jgi:cyclopropane-fatty-acyl-phospholipid synthase
VDLRGGLDAAGIANLIRGIKGERPGARTWAIVPADSLRGLYDVHGDSLRPVLAGDEKLAELLPSPEPVDLFASLTGLVRPLRHPVGRLQRDALLRAPRVQPPSALHPALSCNRRGQRGTKSRRVAKLKGKSKRENPPPMSSRLQAYLQTFGNRSPIPVEVVFHDGSRYRSRPEEPAVRIVFRCRRAQMRVLVFGHIGLLESYFDGDLDVEGDLRLALRFGFDARMSHRPKLPVRIRNRWHELRFSNRTIAQAKANARFHYGHGEDFYEKWLDVPLMMYTCGYWKEGTKTVEEAQRNKIEHVCRKIRLQPGETFVDIGCGFGGFLFHAYERFGALGTGINTTTEQVDCVRREIERKGLADRLRVIEADFREVRGQFDKVVSIGVLEHAGRDSLAEVVKAHAAPLKPGGLGMLHFIGHIEPRETEFYIRKHIFPGGWIPSLAETLVEMRACGLEILDVENLRRHYALTLDAWAERFDARWEQIQALDPKRFGEHFRRAWRTYLYGCAEMFRSPLGETNLFQITFSKGNQSRESYPMSRDFLYREEPAN